MAHLIRIINNIDTGKELLSDTGLGDKTIACIPINNRNEQENKRGSHWSLLVWRKERRRGKFLHYDPIDGMNIEVAKDMVRKLKRLDRFTFEANTKEVDCPRQRNSYDCGIYVIIMMEKILRNLKDNRCIEDIEITQEEADEKRESLRKKIKETKEIDKQTKEISEEKKNEWYIRKLEERVKGYPIVDIITLDNKKELQLKDRNRTEEEIKEIHRMTEKLLKKTPTKVQEKELEEIEEADKRITRSMKNNLHLFQLWFVWWLSVGVVL